METKGKPPGPVSLDRFFLPLSFAGKKNACQSRYTQVFASKRVNEKDGKEDSLCTIQFNSLCTILYAQWSRYIEELQGSAFLMYGRVEELKQDKEIDS